MPVLAPGQPTVTPTPSRWSLVLAAALIAVVGLVAYCNSFDGPFILDDLPAIPENATLQHLSHLGDVFSPPPGGQTVTGRPFLNFTLALNFALSGTDVRSYHAVNLAIHLLAGLTLFGLIRRTLLRPAVAASLREHALPVALASALLWTVHPMVTESVTYIVQRAESQAGLLYLLTLYSFIRSLDSRHRWIWLSGSILACLLGMATKEVMVTAPVIVFLYDRTFVSGTFSGPLRLRWRYYAGLAATWALLGWLVLATGDRGRTAGFGLGISSWSYALKQCEAIIHYLRLAFWPSPLVLDYGFDVVSSWREVVPQGLAVLALLAATIVALLRWPIAGFLGAAFFALLAPSSSFVPVATQTVAEHRMYLPLAAVVVGTVAAGYLVAGRRSLWVFYGCAAVCATLTALRNYDYRSPLSIWADTIAKRPLNARAHQEYAVNLFRAGEVAASIPEYETALRLTPDYARAQHNYASALAAVGRIDEAIAHYEAALKSMPTLFETHVVLGNLLYQNGRWAKACDHFAAALQLRPDLVVIHANLANALVASGRPEMAVGHFEIAVRVAPLDANLRNNFGVALLRLNRLAEAAAQLTEALRLRPDNKDAAANLALLHAQTVAPFSH